MITYITIAFIATAAGLMGLRAGSLKCGYVDAPGGRKKHDCPVPPIGGLILIPVFMLVSYFANLQSIVPWPLMAGLGALMVMGAVDDVRPLKPFLKFAIMVWVACFVVIFGETQIGQLGNLFGFGPVEMGFLSKSFTIMCLVLLMNSINMMDGVDGLAGGVCALILLCMMAAIGFAGGVGSDIFLALSILVAAIAGFLVLNMRSPWSKSAKVFLGDTGALCLGLLIGWFAIKITQNSGEKILAPATIIWFIALPVMDAFALYIARSMRGLNPFHADRRHLHNHIQMLGFSPGWTTSIMLMLVFFMAAFGYAVQMFGLPDAILFYGWLIVFGLHTAANLHPRGYLALVRDLKSKWTNLETFRR